MSNQKPMKKQGVPVGTQIGMWVLGTLCCLAIIGFRKTVAVMSVIGLGTTAYKVVSDETIIIE